MGGEPSKIHIQNAPASRDLGNGVRISTRCKGNTLQELQPNDPKTTYEAFLEGQKCSDNGPLAGTRNKETGQYEWLSYSEISDMSNAFGSGLVTECDLSPLNTTNVGIFSQNRMEWLVSDQACARFSMVPVPLYSTLGDEAMIHIVNQSHLTLVICDTVARANQLTCLNLPPLRCLVVMEPMSENQRKEIEDHGRLSVFSFNDILNSGRLQPLELRPAKADDVCTISYTSGTTGVPKGVVLTHKSLVTSVSAAVSLLAREGEPVTSKDVNFSYLPMAHVYERMNMIVGLLHGTPIGYFGGDITKLLDDVRALRPTLFAAVPRILYKVYDVIHTEAAKSAVKNKMLEWATESKLEELKHGQLRSDTIWDSLVFHKVRDLFGGRVRLLTTGSAAVTPEVMNFFRIALSCAIYSGYGQTETGGVTSVSAPYDFRGDHVGGPLPCCYTKLIDVPDLGYFASDGIGEVCVKGPICFREYYKMPEQTAATIDEDGWVHTGDVGTWSIQGNLRIVDRCKQIFKLSQGEYIAPEKVEGALQRAPHLAQVYVDGKNDKDYLVAIVVPDFDALTVSLGLKATEMDKEALCRDEGVRRKILEEMEVAGREAGLKGFELAKRIHLHHEPFSPENGLLTATMKSKRTELRKRFAAEVDALYNV